MKPRGSHLIGRAIVLWTRWIRRHAAPVILGAVPLTASLAFYAVSNLGINTDTGSMISEELPWRRAFLNFERAFPQFGDEIQVVIDGATPDLAARAQQRLASQLRADTSLFERVYTPGAGEFFDRHALLYMSLEDLEGLADGIARLRPLIGPLERDASLVALQDAIQLAIRSESDIGASELAVVFDGLASAFYLHRIGEPFYISWQEVLEGEPASPEDRRRHIVALPRFDFTAKLPAEAAMSRIRELAEGSRSGWHAVRVRITGTAAIKHESIVAALSGTAWAGILALALVSLVLYLGLRSIRLMLATLATLVFGLSGTSAFAAFAVGHLNLISIAFAVLYIGLGIDYAVHLALGYREAIEAGHPHESALELTAERIGSAVFLSAATTAACFYAFIPTDFTGVSELGVISGTGMLISLLATLTILPAMLTLLPLHPPEGGATSAPLATLGGRAQRAGAFLVRRRRWVLTVAIMLAVGSPLLTSRLRFEYRPIDLADRAAESVTTYNDLVAEGNTAPLTISIVAQDSLSALRTRDFARSLTGVRTALTLHDVVPKDQSEKLLRIAQIEQALGRAVAKTPEVRASEGTTAAGWREALEGLGRILEERYHGERSETAGAARRLRKEVRRWLAMVDRWPARVQEEVATSLNTRLFGSFPGRIAALRSALAAEPVGVADLPPQLVEWWVGTDGTYRVQVISQHPLRTGEDVRRFVELVRGAAPGVTGIPVSDLESARVALSAFRTAVLLALVATSTLLLVQLRSFIAATLALLPLVLAGLTTSATAALIGLPFNFANLIALPLLLGVGVDNGIHMVHRWRTAPAGERLPLATSTGRAVLFSTLTTLASFGSLALSRHRGISSMGSLLTIGMLAVLVSTLIVLPALQAVVEAEKSPRDH